MNIEITKQTRLLTANKVCREDIDIIPILQSKTVTEAGTVLPDAGYLGLSKVIVSTPAASGGSVLDNLDNPRLPKFGRLKVFDITENAVRYKDIYPTVTHYMETGVVTGHGTYAAVDTAGAYAAIYNNFSENFPSLDAVRVVTDTAAYDGYRFCTGIVAFWAHIFMNGRAHVNKMYIPPCVCRITVYNPGSGKVETEEILVSGTTLEAQENNAGTGYTSAAASHFAVNCAMPSNIILGAEFVYSSYKVTLSGGAGKVQYSLDDGVSFKDVTDGMVIPNVEHMVLKNVSSGTVYIGSTSGGSEYAAISAGGTTILPVTAAGTWYIS